MKNIFKYAILSFLPLVMASCVREEIMLPSIGDQDIVLDLSCGKLTKAISAEDLNSVGAEGKVHHVDVMIFGEMTDGRTVYHERLDWEPAFIVEGSRTLAAKRSWFNADQNYEVYVVANSTHPAETFSAMENEEDLWLLVQADQNLHLTGLASNEEGTDADTTPDYFLMDGQAFTSGTSAILNDGDASNGTVLSADLSRAVSKIVLELTAGADVQFKTAAADVYHYRNLPYSTVTVAEQGYEIAPSLSSTKSQPVNAYVTWTPSAEDVTGKITITGYVYSYDWTALDKETSLIVNIPMSYTEGENLTVSDRNYYKIPLSKDKRFERNRYYKVTAVVNALGSESNFDPIILDDLKYDTFPWVDILPPIEVGNETNKPQYLQLNTNHVDMFNVNVDNSTLEFASSSYITEIELVEAYYYDAYDVKKDLSLSTNDKYGIYDSIIAEADSDVLNGGITINSPFVGVSEREIFDILGPVPTVPEMPVEPVDPEVEEAANPGTQADYAAAHSGSQEDFPNPKRGDSYNEYRYNNGFQVRTWTYYNSRGWDPGNWRNDSDMKDAYDAELAAYTAWVAWDSKTEAEKAEAKAEYELDLSTYSTRLEEYQTALAAFNQYNDAVEELKAQSGDSHGNAIRYLKFKVYNSTGQTAEFTVAQYPTLYITNEHGAYSYRSDFGGTTYKKRGDPNRASAHWSNGTWIYSSGNPTDERPTYFFGSKVAVEDGDSYSIEYYKWGNANSPVLESINGLNNPRMYHIHVTATSSQYVVGRPRLDANGYTESSADNTKLVSPSFMIASQLGATLTPEGGIEQARSHCEQYVEVTSDGKVYDDWRLPTAAEIDIIISHQDISDAMIVVLTGAAYYCAYNTNSDGDVIYYKTTGKSGSNTAVRCIRDAY